MKYRIEILIPLLFFGYIAFFPAMSGEISSYFFKANILLPFILVFIALTIMSFGLTQLFEIVKALKCFFLTSHSVNNLKINTLTGAISFSYVSAILWVLYILVVSQSYSLPVSALVPGIALAFTYAFILSELVLRPLKRRLEFIKL